MNNIRKNIIYLFLVAPLLFMSGCTKEEEASFKTVEYYKKNTHIRDKRISECKKIIKMTETIEEDCRNAWIALPKKVIDTSGW